VNALKDVWLAAADREYDTLITRTRDIGADVGDLFCIFAKVVSKGAAWLGPSSQVCGSADLYVMYGKKVMMCFAVCRRQVAIVKWAQMGSEPQQRRELDEAKRRAAQLFP